MAAAAFNFRKWMRLFLLAPKTTSFWERLVEIIANSCGQGVSLAAN